MEPLPDFHGQILHFQDRFAQIVITRHPEHFFVHLIEGQKMGVRSFDEHWIWNGIDQRLDKRKLTLDFSLQLFAFRDVSYHAYEDFFAPYCGLSDAKVYGKLRPVLLLSNDFPRGADDGFLAGFTVTLQVGIVVTRQMLGHQHPYIAAYDVMGAVAKHALGTGVEHLDDSPLIDHDDSVRGIVKNGRDAPFRRLEFGGTVGYFLLQARVEQCQFVHHFLQ